MFMKTLSMIAISVFAVVAAASQSAPTQQLTPIYAMLDALTVKKDMKGLTKMLTSITTKDCVFITAQGKKQTVSDVTGSMTMQMGMIDKVVKSTSHIDKIANSGNSVVATVTSAYELLTKAGGDGKTHKIEGTSKSDDTWIKVGASWRLKSSKTLKEATTMDGKPVSGMG